MLRQYGALSGAAILLIVLNHAIHFGLQVSPVEGRWLNLLTVLQALGAFAVPTFLFVSGAFLSYAARELTVTFIRSSLERLLWPYVIWSAVFYLLLFLTSGVSYAPIGYIKNLLVGYPYHFVPLLIFWYATAPLLVRIGRRYGRVLLAVVAVYQGALLALRFPSMFGLSGELPLWVQLLKPPALFTSFSEWAIYFPLGFVLSLHNATVMPRLIRLRWLALAAAAAVFLLGILNAFSVIAAPWARFLAPVPLMFLLPTIGRASIPLARRLELLGKQSYGIYLAHFVVMNLLVFVVIQMDIGLRRVPFLVFPMFLVMGLGLSLLLMGVMTRAVPARRVYRYVFGIVRSTA